MRAEEKELQKICDSLPKIDFAKKAEELKYFLRLSTRQIEAFLRIKHLLDLSDAILMETHPKDMNELSCRILSVIDKTILREARKLTKNKENEK